MSTAIATRFVTAAEVEALGSAAADGATTLRDELVDCFAHGPRAMRLSGLDPAALGEDGFAKALLAIGRRLGEPSIQSAEGNRVARVERVPGDLQARGTHSDSDLLAHTDMHDILALACVRPAAIGGDSFLVDAHALRDRLAALHPDCLDALRRGYPFGTNPVLQSRHRVSEQPVPVLFDAVPGRPLVCWNGYFMRMAAQERGEPLPGDLATALDALRAVAAELAAEATFRLAPGDVLLWHNWSWLHGRTAFVDDDPAPRLLLRLWLRSDLVPRPPILAERAARIDADHRLTAEQGYRAA